MNTTPRSLSGSEPLLANELTAQASIRLQGQPPTKTQQPHATSPCGSEPVLANDRTAQASIRLQCQPPTKTQQPHATSPCGSEPLLANELTAQASIRPQGQPPTETQHPHATSPCGSAPLLANDRTAPALSQGRCTLVGAGPGDPELLTLKAVKAIASATVILVDDLVNDAVLEHASPTARIVHVGKRGGCKSTPQAFIDKLMITAVHEGEQVVRLKGGDPFIFGRGGEEVEHLRAAGIDVHVVNGITAGLAGMASLGAPLTHREHAHGVVFVTGHAKPGDNGTDWVQLSATARQAKLTLVIYMGVSHLDQISQGLLSGLPAHTPVAVVQHASLPTQREALTTLGELVTTVQREGLQSPSIIVVGDVVQGARAWAAQSNTSQKVA